MGFLSWLFCAILVVALVLLLFPFAFRIDFEAGERGVRALFFFFKKKIYEYEKKWKEEAGSKELAVEGDDKCVDRESRPSSLGHDRDQHLGQERSDCPKTRDESGAELDERRESRPTESGMTEDVESRHPEPRSGEGSSAVPVESRVAKEPEKSEEKKDGVVTAESKAPSTTEKKTAPAKPAEKVAEKPKTEKTKPEAKVKTKDERRNAPPVEVVAKKPAETPKTEPMKVGIDESAKRESLPPSSSKQSEGDSVKSSASNESVTQNAPSTEVKSSLVVEVASDAKVAESENCDSEKNEMLAEDKKPKKEKRKLSDREFWTIILTPDFDARAFKYILKILKAVLTLFRVRFSDCFVEGIRSDYQTMGYIAAVNGFLKAYPYVGDWDLRMDWCNEKELRAAGSVRLSITLLRIFCFTLETLVLAGILALSFWRHRAHVIKTNELPQLGFIRRRILEFILED